MQCNIVYTLYHEPSTCKHITVYFACVCFCCTLHLDFLRIVKQPVELYCFIDHALANGLGSMSGKRMDQKSSRTTYIFKIIGLLSLRPYMTHGQIQKVRMLDPSYLFSYCCDSNRTSCCGSHHFQPTIVLYVFSTNSSLYLSHLSEASR